jgi:hypothetical protein
MLLFSLAVVAAKFMPKMYLEMASLLTLERGSNILYHGLLGYDTTWCGGRVSVF